MKINLHGFLSAFSLVSRIPIRLAREPEYDAVGFWMPLVGLAAAASASLGAAVGQALFGTGYLCAVVIIAFQYVPFNLFHVDGMLDTADAMGVAASGAAGIEKRRAVLKDSRIGSFAFFVGFIYLSARLFATARLSEGGALTLYGALCLAPVSGRFASMLIPALVEPYAKAGLGALVGRPSAFSSALGYVAGVCPAAVLFGLAFGAFGTLVCVLGGGLAAILSALCVGWWYKKNMGGYSGDALGASIELAETLTLLACAAFV